MLLASASLTSSTGPPARKASKVKTYIVTIRMLKKNPDHDPSNKESGRCVVSGYCTDVTGEHHSFLMAGVEDEEEVRELVRKYGQAHGYRLTRLEEVR
jgi:hypothetical protein